MHLSVIGSVILFIGLVVMCLYPFYYGPEPFGLMPGLVIYSFGYGIATTALYRFILFVTQIGTGTTSALISMSSMCFMGAGIEIGNAIFLAKANLGIAQYVGYIALFYFVCVAISLYFHRCEKALGVENL